MPPRERCVIFLKAMARATRESAHEIETALETHDGT